MLPTPDGMFLNNASINSSSLSSMSACLRLVFINLTPQLMSKPTPPGETIPFFSLNAATPPIGNPYPK